MWGFGGLGSARKPFELYSAAVDHLVAMTKIKEHTEERSDPVVVLYWDGDDALNDENANAFSHALFAPWVASKLKAALGDKLKVACVIVKSGKGRKADENKGRAADPENKQENKSIRNKLMKDAGEGTFQLHTATNLSGTKADPGNNSWPFLFDGVFDAWRIVVADTMDNHNSEAKCEALLGFAGFTSIASPRYVIVVGGNTEAGGVKSMIEYQNRKETGKLFDMVVHIPMSHYAA
jgi:hypothetical protein